MVLQTAFKMIRNWLAEGVIQLSDTETYEFFKSDSKITSLDCARFPNFKNGKDESGDDLHISVRRVNGMVDVSIDGLDAH